MKKLNIIISNALMQNGNRGCVALSVSSMYIIDEILSKHNIRYKFYLPQSGHSEYKEYEVNIAGKILRYTAIPDISGTTIKSKVKNLIKYKEYCNTKEIYEKADYIFDIGQGDSFADIYGKNRFDWIFSQYKLGRKYNKPYCILPQTIGPFDNPQIREQAIKGIKWAKCVMARDKQSVDFVKELIPSCNVSEIIDVAFFLPYKKKMFDSSFIHVGLNVSALLWQGGYTKNNQFGLKCDYQKLIREIIKYFLTIDSVKVHLIPHVVSGERGIENDYAVAYDLCEEFNNPNLILAPLFLDPVIAKGYIAGMDFFMGARMHSTIAAFSSGVPVLPMAYSRKFNGLFVDTLEYKHIIDLLKEENMSMLKVVSESYNNRLQLKEEICKAMNGGVKDRKAILYQELCAFINIKS